MSDPIENRLRSFDPGGPMTPLSAADVRRRGDSLRRRKNAFAAVGAAVAIAVIATPIALLSGGSDDKSIDPANPSITDTPSGPPTPRETTTGSTGPATLVSIPDDFPLAAGYPETNDDPSGGATPVEVTDKAGFDQVELCGETVWDTTTPSAPADVAGVTFTGGEDFRARTLALYPDDDAAAAALQAITDGYQACTTDTAGGTDQTYRVLDDADDTLVVAHTYGPAGKQNLGAEITQFVLVDNALFLDSLYGESGTTKQAIAGFAQAAGEASGPVVDALEALMTGQPDPGSDGGTSAPGEEGLVPLDPQDLLMIEDLPAPPDYAAPWQEASDDTLTWECRPQGFDDLGADGSVAVRYQALAPDAGTPPTLRARDAVLQFSNLDDAQAAYDQAVGYLKSCEADQDLSPTGKPLETTDGGGSYLQGFVYAAPETCTDCDAGWFDYMGVALNGQRVVLTSYAQVGGPLPPERIRSKAQDVFAAAISRSGL